VVKQTTNYAVRFDEFDQFPSHSQHGDIVEDTIRLDDDNPIGLIVRYFPGHLVFKKQMPRKQNIRCKCNSDGFTSGSDPGAGWSISNEGVSIRRKNVRLFMHTSSSMEQADDQLWWIDAGYMVA
jgi:hypothetical protein